MTKHTELRQAAEAIADDLFVAGNGEFADRLAMMDADGRDLGGWGYGPAVDRIESVLRLHRASEAEAAERLREELAALRASHERLREAANYALGVEQAIGPRDTIVGRNEQVIDRLRAALSAAPSSKDAET